ncbi:MAG: hypothetical protein V1754_07475, partial [Pseudomonadota bacterium]
LPSIAPTGKYQLVLRARDRLLKDAEAIREYHFQIKGNPPARLSSFKIDGLDIQERPDLAPIKGDTFVRGKTYHLTLSVGGAKLKEIQKLTYFAKMEGHLKIRDLRQNIVHESNRLFHLEKKLHYRPLRILLSAQWITPSDIPLGLYDLEVHAVNLLDNRVSQLVRRVEVVDTTP